MISNKTIMIFGGTGSLGKQLIQRYIGDNKIVNFSRDEEKHWRFDLMFKSDKLKHIIGDIRDFNAVENAILRVKPNIIIVASALKHIDRCEYAVNECIMTNLNGIINVTNVVEKNQVSLKELESVVFISTDKACSPVNAYGASKFLAEKIQIEKSIYIPSIKFITVRYGNVLNSRGSIIPMLHDKGNDETVTSFSLTHEKMTRFVMTLNQSVDLIEYSILNAESGDIVIPELISMNVKDLIELFSEKYNKPIVITGLRPGEKMLESLINETQSMSMVKNGNYYHIKPPYKNICNLDQIRDYNSTINPLSKDKLKEYLIDLDLF